MNTPNRWRRIAGWILIGLLSAVFAASAFGKLSGAKQVVDMMGQWGLGNQVLLIGAGELVSAVLFLILRTHSLGLMLLKSPDAGAMKSRAVTSA